MDRFVTQAKGPPMHDEKVPGVQLEKGLRRFRGIDVGARHEPAGFIGPQIEDGEIDRKFSSQFRETAEIGRIPRDEDIDPARALDQKGPPQGIVGADQGILSPDFVGPLYDRIEQRTAGVAGTTPTFNATTTSSTCAVTPFK